MTSRARWLSLASFVVLQLLGWGVSWLILQVRRTPLPSEAISELVEKASAAERSSQVAWPGATLQVSTAAAALVLEEAFVRKLAVELDKDGLSVVPVASSGVPKNCAEGDTSGCLAALEAEAAVEATLGLAISTGDYELIVSMCDQATSSLILDSRNRAFLHWSSSASPKLSDLAHVVAASLRKSWFQGLALEKDQLFELAPSYALSFFLVGDCEKRVSWDFPNTVIAPFLRRFLDRLHGLFEFEIDSQVVQCGDLGGKRRPMKDGGGTAVSTENLQTDFLRHTGDWPKDTITKHSYWVPPLVHLAAFQSSKPLRIVDPEGKEQGSFAVQGWGILSILQPNDADQTLAGVLASSQAQQAASAWISGLRSWLALPPGGPESFTEESLQVVAVQPVFDGISDWELRRVARAVHAHFVKRAASTLTDLVSLVDRLPDLAVREEVAGNALEATMSVNRALSAAADGKPAEALGAARRALRLALETQHDDSVVAEMFFSMEFKFAVYLPLAMPILLPVCSALYRETLQMIQKLKGVA